jgi:hypothetical protein
MPEYVSDGTNWKPKPQEKPKTPPEVPAAMDLRVRHKQRDEVVSGKVRVKPIPPKPQAGGKPTGGSDAKLGK